MAPFSPADKKAFYDAATAMWKERAEEIGKNALVYREMVMKALEENRVKQ